MNPPPTHPTTTDCNLFLLICENHSTGWPIVAATKNLTTEVVVGFLNEKIVSAFWAFGVILSDSMSYFRTQPVQEFPKQWKTKKNTVLAYAPNSNRTVERMVGTIEGGVARLFIGSKVEWDSAVAKVVFRYFGLSMKVFSSSFDLLYCFKPKVLADEQHPIGASVIPRACKTEIFRRLYWGYPRWTWALTRRNLGIWSEMATMYEIWSSSRTELFYGSKMASF